MTATPVPAPPKRRRSPAIIAVAVALVAVGGLLSFYLYSSVSETTSVVAAAETIERGSVIDAEDLVSVQITNDPALSTVNAADADSLIGQRASVDIAAGSLVTTDSTADELVPSSGESVVGLNLTAGQRPALELKTGDRVRIISVPADGFQASANGLGATDAVVVAVGELGVDGARVVDVAVEESVAAELAAQASTGRVALVLDSREN